MQLWSLSRHLGLNNKRVMGVLLFFSLAVIVFFTIRARMWTWTAESLPSPAPKMISDTGVQMQSASQNAASPNMATKFFAPITNKFPHNLTPMCNDVAVQMVKGNWVMRDYSESEMREVQIFINRTREDQGVPATYERPDQKCGNVDYGPLLKIRNKLKWKRALCNPLGAKPCCYENKCAAKSIEECRCPQCYDLRQEIHAELANWVPSDPKCKIRYFSSAQACQVLQNMTIYFIGDSFLRQIATAFLELLRINTPDGSLIETRPIKVKQSCDKYYRYESACRTAIMDNSVECNNTVILRKKMLWITSQAKDILATMSELKGKPNSLIVFGLGIHDSFNFDKVKKKILTPVMNLLSRSTWPRLIWAAPHAPGLMKTPLVLSQQTKNVLLYNSKVQEFMDQYGIPVLNFYPLTEGIMAYDGVHYGKGVNDVKMQIILNYILEMRST